MFAQFFVVAILNAIGYPKSKGIFNKRHIVEAVTFDSSLIQLARLAAAVTIGDDSTTAYLLADSYPGQKWNKKTLDEVLDQADPIKEVERSPEYAPWVAFSPTTSVGPNGGLNRPDEQLMWNLLAETAVTDAMTQTLVSGIAFTLRHPELSESALNSDVGLNGATRKFLARFRVDVLPFENIGVLQENAELVISGYKEYSGVQSHPKSLQNLVSKLRKI